MKQTHAVLYRQSVVCIVWCLFAAHDTVRCISLLAETRYTGRTESVDLFLAVRQRKHTQGLAVEICLSIKRVQYDKMN